LEIWTTVRNPKVPFAIAAAFLLFGIGLTVHQIAVLRSSIAEAETVQSRVLSIENDSGPVEYQPEVELRYRVGDRQYVSKTTAMSNPTTYPDAKRIVDSYSPGSRHVVHYLSGNPARIYANAGYTLDFFFGSILLLSLGALFLLLGMLMRRKFTQAEQVRWSGWLFASIGLVFLLIGSELAYSQGKAAKTQPSLTNAQVVTSRVHRYVRTRNGAGMKSNEVTFDETYYELIAEFRYSVEGRSFLSPGAENVRKSNQINPTLAQYSPGSWHQISYDPHNPNDIHIHDWPDQVSQRTWVFVSFGLGLVFLLIGGALIFASRSPGVQASALEGYQRRRHYSRFKAR
jgi:hypothetical protein